MLGPFSSLGRVIPSAAGTARAVPGAHKVPANHEVILISGHPGFGLLSFWLRAAWTCWDQDATGTESGSPVSVWKHVIWTPNSFRNQ